MIPLAKVARFRIIQEFPAKPSALSAAGNRSNPHQELCKRVPEKRLINPTLAPGQTILSGHAGYIITLRKPRAHFAPESCDSSTAPIQRAGGQVAGVALQLDQVVGGVHAA
jgi:hypothetical protein